MIKKHWWKGLSVLILLYVFIVGMRTPLAQGISSSYPINIKSGEMVTLDVEGYNTYYTKGINNAFLKLDSIHAISPKQIKIIDDRNLKITFIIPNELPYNESISEATLVVNNTLKGYAIYPDAVQIRTPKEVNKLNSEKWSNSPDFELTEVDEFDFPFRNILMETIRNTYFHVPLWFSMIFIFLASMINSIKYLRNDFDVQYDIKSKALIEIGVLFGILGTVTGGIWAQFTWGAFWSFDIKQNMTAITLLIYLAYFVLRSSFDDDQQKARLAAIYNIFAFTSIIPLLFIIPRMYDSLHPGNGGNPAFGGEDLDNTMRTVFYPAIIGFTLLGFWIANVLTRINNVRQQLIDRM